MSSKQFKILVNEDYQVNVPSLPFRDALQEIKYCYRNGFDGYVFVPEYRRDLVDCNRKDHYVIGVLGNGISDLKPVLLTEPSVMLQGFIVRANCNGVLEDFDLKFARTGNGAIYVDQYMCGADGKPVIEGELWTVFCTSVNTSSSEGFLIGINYLGPYCDKAIVDGNIMHANYIFWRNSTIMALSHNSVLDTPKFKCRCNNALIVNLKEKELNEMVVGLLRKGKLLIRNNGKLLNFGNHLVNVP
nr:pol1ab fusion protein [RNA transcription vector pBRDI1]